MTIRLPCFSQNRFELKKPKQISSMPTKKLKVLIVPIGLLDVLLLSRQHVHVQGYYDAGKEYHFRRKARDFRVKEIERLTLHS